MEESIVGTTKVCTSVGWLSKIKKQAPAVIRMILRVHNREILKNQRTGFLIYKHAIVKHSEKSNNHVYNCQFSSLKPPVLPSSRVLK